MFHMCIRLIFHDVFVFFTTSYIYLVARATKIVTLPSSYIVYYLIIHIYLYVYTHLLTIYLPNYLPTYLITKYPHMYHIPTYFFTKYLYPTYLLCTPTYVLSIYVVTKLFIRYVHIPTYPLAT
jgi:hypothetical protein